MTPQERDRKIEEIARRVAERLKQEWPDHEAHINDLEDLAERVGRTVMREVTEELLREQVARRKRSETACTCGAQAEFKRCHSLTLVTLHGRFPVARPYYYCARCRHGSCPVDQEWNLGPAHTTPSVQSLVGGLAALVSYVQVPHVLRRCHVPITLSIKSREQIAQRLGARVQGAPPTMAGPAQHPLAVAVDAAMLPLRYGHHQETRCGVIYEPHEAAMRTPAGEASLRKEYLATTLGSRDALVQAVCARVEARRPTPETKVAALGDGAHWIWENYAKYLPHREEILDFYHVTEHLGTVAQAMYGRGREAERAALAWNRERQKELKEAGPEPLLACLGAWEPESDTAREVKRRELNYFLNNQARMNYPEYLKQGLPIGSGAVEGACKHLVSDRFRGSGMQWQPATAEPLLHLRAALLTQPDLELRPYLTPPLLA
jgi:hypothetical protein